ncbi:AraC family transcriptional regulator [Paenibacillus ginsengarvi]|uniref:AraC family transcriptional regulator n=1 Tax=Paenibacillus ginsengarvi TaxID=400777 RepID=A0A3B0CQW1_9BACL|nr:AraC family transcriptional regulator [Paenibacillus ginsengarvi]RKN85756.1 AraC family transcriptional regulator [Paenibacillus ginsengarvi]
MDWVQRMERAIGYVEEHLAGELDYGAAAQIACCPAGHFQRMFAFLTDVSLSEYVRRRRLTLAAFELQNSSKKVIDLALKYGYDSPEAFARAFQQLHGTTPTAARSAGAALKAYPRISFQFSIKGVTEMNYRIERLARFSVVGVQERVDTASAFAQVSRLWAKAQKAGLFERLWDLLEPGHAMSGILGVCADGEFGAAERFHYIMSVASRQSPGEGMIRRDFPEATWAVFEAKGGPEAITDIWKRLYTEWLPVSSYDLANVPTVECYLPPEQHKNELWVAVIKK